MHWRRQRKNGFSRPLSTDQLTAGTTYVVVTTAYFLLVNATLSGVRLAVVDAVHAALVVSLVSSWLATETTNPAGDERPCVTFWCFGKTLETSRYCASCQKSVIGLDHHCTWLNTCIGRKNYASFFTLICVGFAQMCVQVVVSVLLLSAWLKGDVQRRAEAAVGSLDAFRALSAIEAAVSCVVGCAFGVIFFFHLFLVLIARKGTYDWLVARRASKSGFETSDMEMPDPKKQAEIARRQEKERAEWVERTKAARARAQKLKDQRQERQRREEGDSTGEDDGVRPAQLAPVTSTDNGDDGDRVVIGRSSSDAPDVRPPSALGPAESVADEPLPPSNAASINLGAEERVL